jgi:hypothetical protein
MPARAAPLWPMPGIEPHMSATMLITAPPCCCMLWLKHSRATKNPPVRLVSMTACQPLALVLAKGEMY